MNNITFVLVIYLVLQVKYGRTIKIQSKVDFGDSAPLVRYAAGATRDVDVFKSSSGDSIDPLAYTNTVIVNQNLGSSKLEKNLDEDEKVNYICKNRICVYGIDKDDQQSKSKKVINDVQVIISTSDDAKDDAKGKTTEDSDIPVIKGFKGVRPEDINYDNDDDSDEVKATKNDKEQPSVIITNQRSDEPIIITPDVTDNKIPPVNLQPPIFEPSNWKTYSQDNWYNQRDFSDIRPQDYPKSFQSDRRQDGVNRGYGVRIPSGWSSNWRPISRPAVHSHYPSPGRGQEYPGDSPHFVTVCSCSRQPVAGKGTPHPPQPSPPRPWYPEATHRPRIDDKLAKPFSKT